jgi:hypothetical protein
MAEKNEVVNIRRGRNAVSLKPAQAVEDDEKKVEVLGKKVQSSDGRLS